MMRKLLSGLVLLLCATSTPVIADDSKTNRENSNFGIDIGYVPISLPLPATKAISLYYLVNSNWQIGFEYAWTTIGLTAFSYELGEVEETNRTIKARYFASNSFNWIMGYGRRGLKVKLAANLFDLVTHDYTNTATRTRTEYAQVGFGSQW